MNTFSFCNAPIKTMTSSVQNQNLQSACCITKHKLYQPGDVPIHEFIRVNKMIPYKSLCYKIKKQNRTTRSVLEY